jgi:hypothetical protein
MSPSEKFRGLPLDDEPPPPPPFDREDELKLLPSPSVSKATSPSFRNVPQLKGLNRKSLVRKTAGEIASAADIACIRMTFPANPAYHGDYANLNGPVPAKTA